jgi:hypothetical protein
MSNFLAGDFDAVFQLSRGTVNRLLATTHQNKEGYSKKMPLSPQKLAGRIGSYESVTVGADDRDRILRFKHCLSPEPSSY